MEKFYFLICNLQPVCYTAPAMADNDQILKALESIKKDMATKADIEPINKRLDAQGSSIARLEQGLAQANTSIGQIKTVLETTEETVNSMDEALKEVVQDHRERI